MKLECVRCHLTWKQAAPVWSRGHLLMKRGGKTVFVGDDLGYAFDAPIQIVVAPLLREIGYSNFSTDPCLRCGHEHAQLARGLLAPASYGSEDIACAFLLEDDIIKVGREWQLRPDVAEALTRP